MFLIYALNRIARAVCTVTVAPFINSSPWVGMTIISLIVSVLALLVFKYFSNQKKLQRAKDVAFARILEIRIYKDDLGGIFGAFGRITSATAKYFFRCLIPMAVMIIPILLLIVQMAQLFESSPLKAGEKAIVNVVFSEKITSEDVVSLDVSEGVSVDTDAFISPVGNEVSWRISVAEDNGPQWIDIRHGDRLFRKSVSVWNGETKAVSGKLAQTMLSRLETPSDSWLHPEDGIESIDISYPSRSLQLGYTSINWLVAFFVLTMLMGLILKYPLRISI